MTFTVSLRFHDIRHEPKAREWFYFQCFYREIRGLFKSLFSMILIRGPQPGKSNSIHYIEGSRQRLFAKTRAYFTSHENSEFLWNI